MTATIKIKEIGTSNFLSVPAERIAQAKFIDKGTSALNSLLVTFTSEILSGSYEPFYNREMKLDINGTEVFGGKIERQKSMKQAHPLYEVEAWSYGAELLDNYVNKIYASTTPEDIVEDIIDTYTNLTYASTVTTGISIDRIVFRNKTAAEVVQQMADLLDYFFYTDADKNAYFEPKGTVSSGVILDVTAGSVLYPPIWEYNTNEVVTSVTVEGGLQNFDTSESFSASASQTDFTITYEPAGQIRVTVDGTEKDPQVTGATTGDYTVDSENKTITFLSPMTGGEAVVIYYSYAVPIRISAQVDTFDGDGQQITKQKLLKKKNLKSFGEARRYANKYLEKFGTPQKSATITYIGFPSGLEAGKTCTVIDTNEGINENLVIEEIVYYYETNTTEITVGSSPDLVFNWQAEVSERLRDLTQEDSNADVLQDYRQMKHNLGVSLQEEKKVYTRNVGDSFVVGHQTLGRSRTDLNFEADCSNTGNHGTWSGSDIDGGQYGLINNTLLGYMFHLSSPLTPVVGSSISYSGTLSQTTGFYGETNGAIDFPATSNVLWEGHPAVAIFNSLTQLSIATEVLISSSITNEVLTQRMESFILSVVNNVARFGVYTSGSWKYTTGTTLLNDSVEHTIAGTWDGSNIRVYVDGVLDGSATAATGTLALSLNEFSIGGLVDPGGSPVSSVFSGKMRSISFYDVGLSESQVEDWHRQRTVGAIGWRNSAGYFNGTDNRVVGPTGLLTSADGCSIFAVINSSDLKAGRIVAQAYGSTSGARSGSLGMNADKSITFYMRNASGGVQCQSAPLENNTTYTLLGTYDRSTGEMNLYINGTNVDTETLSGTPLDGSAAVYVGWSADSNDTYYEGMIDEVLIFNTAITSATHAELINKTFYSTSAEFSNCRLWWSFDNPRIGDRRGPLVLRETI